ncbi:MAG: nucleotidyltransferase domain-containing protein [Alphaproteobacteria bacterium]|nr:MAG: nucleotidyltransferase domain-containing protein [Alphaproteobacteria bacterium]
MSITQPPLQLTREHQQLVQGILDQVLPGIAVLVFGSRATGRARRYSDLDLVLLGNAPLPLAVMADLREAFDQSDLPFPVDVVEWCRLSPDMQAVIARDGAPLPPLSP